ncbi:MAG: YceI family protein [Myxococcaceae bacterium]
MKRIWVSAALAAGLIGTPSLADGPVTSRLWFQGELPIYAFRCDAKRVETGLTGLDQAGTIEAFGRSEIGGALKILVASLDCDNGMMNEELRNALKMREHPEIFLKMKSLQLGERKGDVVEVLAKAELTLSGQTRSIVVNGVAKETPRGVVMLGEHQLKMTDYGVQPPSLLLGTIRVKDEVTVGFEFTIAAATQAATAVDPAR